MIGTPDDLIAAIRDLQEMTGGFGVVLGFAHDWANWENTQALVGPGRPLRRCPRVNGYVRPLQASADYLARQPGRADGRRRPAVMSKIMSHEGAAAGDGHHHGEHGQGTRSGRGRHHVPPGAGLADAHGTNSDHS